jgi:hypothetical protein
MTNFADTLPDLTKPHVPYPNPQNTAEVCANRLAAIQTGAMKHHNSAWGVEYVTRQEFKELENVVKELMRRVGE